ncbi:DUF3592 domain-containing protein [Streptomyces sp. NBC_01498]|uniref:DUF3592 domain-containing protein n=1 Tax=Streptomyces sp. NBC_01498 TaxID=2975870 RepID=UPI002E7AB408|nr:DUF3592 domain-containing protein [Streptomyces sp. NBC_01498]WTL28458.1 DUF3592 domain-containing protein [Streptomyces sp. NBC_01498]
MPGQLFPLVFAVVGALVFGIGAVGLWRSLALVREGVRASGTVVRLETSYNHQGGSTHRPVVGWVTEDGRHMEVESPYGRSWVGGFRPGTPVRLRYDPLRPERMRIDGYGHGVQVVFVLVGLGFLVGGLSTALRLTG